MLIAIAVAAAGFLILAMVLMIPPWAEKRLGGQYAPTKRRRHRRNRGYDLTLEQARPGPRSRDDPMP